MSRYALLSLLAITTFGSIACSVNPTLLHEPEEYAKLRGIEVVTREPTRPYEVLITTKASGGRHTVLSTMINAMIDDARKAGADALIPLEGATERKNIKGLEVFSFVEEGRTVAWARAIKWK